MQAAQAARGAETLAPWPDVCVVPGVRVGVEGVEGREEMNERFWIVAWGLGFVLGVLVGRIMVG